MPFRKRVKVIKIRRPRKKVIYESYKTQPATESMKMRSTSDKAVQSIGGGTRILSRIHESTMVQKGPSPYPSRFYTNLKYCHLTGLTTPSTNLVGAITFRLNGPYDPDQTGVGGQPQYYDQMAIMYARQRTLGCTFQLRFTNPDGVRYWGGYRIRRAGDTASAGLAYNDIKPQRWTTLQPVSTTGSRGMVIKGYVKPNVIYGDSKADLRDDDDYESLVSTVPSKEVYLDILCYNPTATAVGAMVEIQMNYNIVFTGLKYITDV